MFDNGKKAIVEEAIESRKAPLSELSDAIWGYAETAFLEFKSSAAIIKMLEKEGFTVEKNIAGIETAFKGTYGQGSPVIGVLGEFDALYNLSQKSGIPEKIAEVPGGNGHGCGHNLLGVGALAGAIAVKEYLKKTGASGTVIYFGCPAEEGGSGKAFMARDGAFDPLDAAVTWHPGSENYVCTVTNLANIQAKFTFRGREAHAAASPHRGRSALDALELMNVGINFMREHVQSDARIHYSITNGGGKSPNVVQPIAEGIYLVRSPRMKDAKEMYEWVCDIARGAAMMTQTSVEIDFMKAASNRVPVHVMERLMYKNMKEFPLPEVTKEDLEAAAAFRKTYEPDYLKFRDRFVDFSEEATKAYAENESEPIFRYVVPLESTNRQEFSSSDVGDVSWVCPTVQITAACTSFGTPAHAWQRVAQVKLPFAHKGMLFAGKVIAGTVIDLLTDPETLDAAKKEHRAKVGPDGYVCPIPKGVKPRPI